MTLTVPVTDCDIGNISDILMVTVTIACSDSYNGSDIDSNSDDGSDRCSDINSENN